jgi:hypothetical protein
MPAELIQTLVNAVLLIGVTLIAGSIGLKRFEAIDRRFETIDRRFETLEGTVNDRFESLEARMDDRFDSLRTELKHDIAAVDGHVGDVRTELAQTRSDLTYVALAVGAHRSEGSA